MMLRILAVAAVVVILAAALAAGPALAAKGGNGNGKGSGGNGGTSPTLTVSPDPAPADDWFHTEGCGYAVGKVVNILVKHEATDFFAVGVDGSGCISFDWMTSEPNTYTVEAYQNLKGKKQTLMATTPFLVQ